MENDRKQYDVVMLSTAWDDIDRLVAYLNTLSASAAEALLNELIETIHRLDQMPFRCPQARNEPYARRGFRYLVVKHYLVFFIVSGQRVLIHRIVDGRSDYVL